MLMLSQAPGGALSARKCVLSSTSTFTTNPPLFPKRKPKFAPRLNLAKPLNLTRAKAERGVESNSTTNQAFSASTTTPPFDNDQTVFVGQENVPLEGVIQFEKPSSSSSRLNKWGRVALLAGGDVLSLLLFTAIGRFSHGFSVFDADTLRTADPFVAGWFLGAYFLGGFGEDGRGMNGLSKAVSAAAKSWAVGIPLGLIIRAATAGHIPPFTFILVTMGSTAVLLVGWRALLFSFLPSVAHVLNTKVVIVTVDPMLVYHIDIL
ncbi:hypothetical protein FEM48_Zijuj06G0046700 [Ziziphus jujuba var. spinosa]|uniref:Transmembrane protein n=1 Tax=Ziziphus jujuba var. spinosa TaxID=714518 RepID=A0A978V779_ZIZJJ|nr:hypothetical protein FEM48_Zijuj06G0046700 [Ziziphus jujuba var. spinosa]